MSKKSTKKNKQKKKQKVIYEPTVDSGYELKKLVIFILVIVLLFGTFYIISLFINRKDDGNKIIRNNEPAVIQYDEIILGTLLNQSNDNYYVLVSDEDNDGLYDSLMNSYKTKEDSLRVYTSDLNSPFNKMYLALGDEGSNFNIDSVKELRLKNDTLLKISEHRIVEHFEGVEAILNELKKLTQD